MGCGVRGEGFYKATRGAVCMWGGKWGVRDSTRLLEVLYVWGVCGVSDSTRLLEVLCVCGVYAGCVKVCGEGWVGGFQGV